jgi:dimeric dUTPase (all-alpha-NTP-PPase superfamily)
MTLYTHQILFYTIQTSDIQTKYSKLMHILQSLLVTAQYSDNIKVPARTKTSEMFFAEFKSIFGTLCFQDFADSRRSTEEYRDFSTLYGS